MTDSTKTASLWKRLPIWVMDVNERRVYGIGREPSMLRFRLPWSHLMSVRMANETGLLGTETKP